MKPVQTLADMLILFRHELLRYYPDKEIRSLFYLSAEYLLNYSKIDIHVRGAEPISDDVVEKFGQIVHRLRNWEPVQYITGNTEFYGLPFTVDKRVLIPRPETEELVAWMINSEKEQAISILDIGTGSGCIAVALAVNLTKGNVSACDISDEALAVAHINAKKNEAKVKFFRFDVMNGNTALPSKFHIMVSNPPYVRHSEKQFMRNNVLEHEPGLALFVSDQDPLVFYRHIALLGRKYLFDGGKLYLEINENFPHEIVRLLENTGFCGVEIRSDLNGKSRMVRAIK